MPDLRRRPWIQAAGRLLLHDSHGVGHCVAFHQDVSEDVGTTESPGRLGAEDLDTRARIGLGLVQTAYEQQWSRSQVAQDRELLWRAPRPPDRCRTEGDARLQSADEVQDAGDHRDRPRVGCRGQALVRGQFGGLLAGAGGVDGERERGGQQALGALRGVGQIERPFVWPGEAASKHADRLHPSDELVVGGRLKQRLRPGDRFGGGRKIASLHARTPEGDEHFDALDIACREVQRSFVVRLRRGVARSRPCLRQCEADPQPHSRLRRFDQRTTQRLHGRDRIARGACTRSGALEHGHDPSVARGLGVQQQVGDKLGPDSIGVEHSPGSGTQPSSLVVGQVLEQRVEDERVPGVEVDERRRDGVGRRSVERRDPGGSSERGERAEHGERLAQPDDATTPGSDVGDEAPRRSARREVLRQEWVAARPRPSSLRFRAADSEKGADRLGRQGLELDDGGSRQQPFEVGLLSRRERTRRREHPGAAHREPAQRLRVCAVDVVCDHDRVVPLRYRREHCRLAATGGRQHHDGTGGQRRHDGLQCRVALEERPAHRRSG